MIGMPARYGSRQPGSPHALHVGEVIQSLACSTCVELFTISLSIIVKVLSLLVECSISTKRRIQLMARILASLGRQLVITLLFAASGNNYYFSVEAEFCWYYLTCAQKLCVVYEVPSPV